MKLGMSEQGLYAYLLSIKDTSIRKNQVIKYFVDKGDTKNSVEVAWKNLYDLGYLELKRLGKPKGVEWKVINKLSTI